MSLSTVVEWLNENEQRAYPLTSNSTRFHNWNGQQVDIYRLIVDANIVYSSTMPEVVQLYHLQKTGNQLVISIVDGESFFITGLSGTVYARNNNSLIVLSNIEDLLPGDGLLYFNNVYLEPTVVTEIDGALAGVSSITFKDETISSGSINLISGKQTSILTEGHTLHVTVGRNEGIPIGCENFFPTELTYDCDSVISFINGATVLASGDTIKLVAGNNIKIYEDNEKNRIYIGLDFESTDKCVIPTLPPPV